MLRKELAELGEGTRPLDGRTPLYLYITIDVCVRATECWRCLPFAIEALEHQFDEMLASKAKELTRRPWQYFRDHFYCTFWFETVAPKLLLETIGVGNVLFETDFPHPTSLYPGVQAHLVDTLGGYSREVQKKVLQDNAVKLYNLPF